MPWRRGQQGPSPAVLAAGSHHHPGRGWCCCSRSWQGARPGTAMDLLLLFLSIFCPHTNTLWISPSYPKRGAQQVGALYEHNTPVVTIPMSYGGTRVFPPCRREENSKRGRQKPEQCSHPSELMHATKPTTKRIIFPSRQSSRCSVLLKSPQQLIAG